jgi:hypothetical protein
MKWGKQITKFTTQLYKQPSNQIHNTIENKKVENKSKRKCLRMMNRWEEIEDGEDGDGEDGGDTETKLELWGDGGGYEIEMEKTRLRRRCDSAIQRRGHLARIITCVRLI